MLAGYAYGTHRRNAVWFDEDTLWKDNAQKSPHNGRGLMIYGLTQMNRGDYTQALATFEQALQYTPNYATLEINLAVVNGLMADQGDGSKTAAAEQHFLRAISLGPNDDAAPAYYGRWLMDHARFGEALYQLQRAVKLNPSREFQRDLLIDSYMRAGDQAGAKQAAQETLAAIPDDHTAQAALADSSGGAAYWINLSLKQSQDARYSESIVSAKRALAIDPRSAEAYNNIGAALGAMRQWDEAIEAEQRALELNPALQIARNNLSWFSKQSASGEPAKTATELVDESLFLGQQGSYDASIVAAKKALALDPRSAEALEQHRGSERSTAPLGHGDRRSAAGYRAEAGLSARKE